MYRTYITATLLSAGLAAGVLGISSCKKSEEPQDIAISGQSEGPAPTAANVIQLAPPTNPEPVQAQTVDPPTPTVTRSDALRHWMMLLGVLLILFLLSLFAFHTMGRRLGKRHFRAHGPTRHADIWSSHKPPQFLDP